MMRILFLSLLLLNTQVINYGEVKVYYIDTYGNFLDDIEVISKEVGENYQTKEKEFANYHLVRVDGPTEGIILNNPEEVYYMYDLDNEYINTGIEDYDFLLINLGCLIILWGVKYFYEKNNY